MSAVVDSREASAKGGGESTILKGLKKYLGDENVTVENLGNAIDYAIPDIHANYHIIQRKRATEMPSMKKVLDDIAEMKVISQEQGYKPYLLIEGALSQIEKFMKWGTAPVIGVVEAVILPPEWGGWDMHIIPSPNIKWTIQWLAARAKKLGKPREKKPLHIFRTVPEEMSEKDRAIYFMSGFPGYSWKLASRIVEFYGSPWEALSHIHNWRLDIEGIGRGKRDDAEKVLFFDLKKSD